MLGSYMESKSRRAGLTPPAPPLLQLELPRGSVLLSNQAWIFVARSLRFTMRELEIVRGVFDNLTDGSIAASLRLSPHTVHSHLNRLFKKLHVTTRAQMVVRVFQELQTLTLSPGSSLPPVCPNHAAGKCPLQSGCDGISRRQIVRAV